MERVVKLREYIILVLLYILILGLITLNSDGIMEYVTALSPFGKEYSIPILGYVFMLIMYLEPIIMLFIIKTREELTNFKTISRYNGLKRNLQIVLLVLIHFIFWLSIIFKVHYIITSLILTTIGCYKVLFDKVYIGNEYFILSKKKYYYNKISNIVDKLESDIGIETDTDIYTLDCMSKRIKEALLLKFKEKCISISE